MKTNRVATNQGAQPRRRDGGSRVGPMRQARATTARQWLGALLATLLLAACAREKVFRWEEEVVLTGGETLLLERTTRYRRSGEPYNPMKTSWAPEDSGIVVRSGPEGLVGATYAVRDWIEPVVLDRDPQSRDLVMVGTAWNCDWVRKYAGKAKGLYVAFRLRPGVEAEAIAVPDWAWGRTRNLYLTYFEIEPPKRVTPAEAERHNKNDARGHQRFFLIDPDYRASGC